MSEIRDKGIEKMLQIIRHAFSPENAVERMFSEVTGLTFVDRKAELPTTPYKPFDPAEDEGYRVARTVYNAGQQNMLKASWVKEI